MMVSIAHNNVKQARFGLAVGVNSRWAVLEASIAAEVEDSKIELNSTAAVGEVGEAAGYAAGEEAAVVSAGKSAAAADS
jgi:hypothetical protein